MKFPNVNLEDSLDPLVDNAAQVKNTSDTLDDFEIDTPFGSTDVRAESLLLEQADIKIKVTKAIYLCILNTNFFCILFIILAA